MTLSIILDYVVIFFIVYYQYLNFGADSATDPPHALFIPFTVMTLHT